MTHTPLSFAAVYQHLAARVECGHWWPAESDFEIIIGAVLTQNTAWTNVERAIGRLRDHGLLSPSALLALPAAQIAPIIRPAGYMNVKARYVRNVSRWYEAHHADASSLDTPSLRASLMSVTGVGPETADDILLYVYDRPIFIWDVYARRLLSHVGYQVPATYEAARRSLSGHVECAGLSVPELQHFHGLIVEAGKAATRNGGYAHIFPASDLDTRL